MDTLDSMLNTYTEAGTVASGDGKAAGGGAAPFPLLRPQSVPSFVSMDPANPSKPPKKEKLKPRDRSRLSEAVALTDTGA